jgi:Mn2+/Fe2+ NRAMP family transporter
MILLVGVMSLVFVVTALSAGPNLVDIASDIFPPRIPGGAAVTVVALIGTTVVPYNLFLHASAVHQKWSAAANLEPTLRAARFDTVFSVILGGGITLAIMVTATGLHEKGLIIESASQMAQQLEPLLGQWAKYFFAAGLLAAGLTSAITAPLAAAYATAGVLGWEGGMNSKKFKLVWATIILVGTTFAFFGRKPMQAIVFAQAANGVLLPLVAVFLLVAMNRKSLLGQYRNRLLSNGLGIVVVLVAACLGANSLYRVIQRILP